MSDSLVLFFPVPKPQCYKFELDLYADDIALVAGNQENLKSIQNYRVG